jgi:hypothetical protein
VIEFTEGVLTAKPTGVSIISATAVRTASAVNLFIGDSSWAGSLAMKAGGLLRVAKIFRKRNRGSRWNL